ncbi:DUF397 domain-containing protein [Streptomyces massasporeus]|uniref:DUF397 domain-containing protein n=1 Tax=Streptomyces massasporeus TaxID=67324 RepID=A0ABW6LR47_9ACTN
MRDSKSPDGPVLVVTRSAWSAFLGSVRYGGGLRGGPAALP